MNIMIAYVIRHMISDIRVKKKWFTFLILKYVSSIEF